MRAPHAVAAALACWACSDVTLTERGDEPADGGPAGDPEARVEPSSIDFDEVQVAEGDPERLSVTRPVVIHNDGSATLLVRDVAMEEDDPAFSVGSVSLPSVPSGGSLTLDVTFNPTAAGPATDALLIDTSDPVSALWVVELRGVGVGGR
jgi:hypothetical protein